MKYTLVLDQQMLNILSEIIGEVSMPMKKTLPLMNEIQRQVNEQIQKANEAPPPKGNGELKEGVTQ